MIFSDFFNQCIDNLVAVTSSEMIMIAMARFGRAVGLITSYVNNRITKRKCFCSRPPHRQFAALVRQHQPTGHLSFELETRQLAQNSKEEQARLQVVCKLVLELECCTGSTWRCILYHFSIDSNGPGAWTVVPMHGLSSCGPFKSREKDRPRPMNIIYPWNLGIEKKAILIISSNGTY